MKKILLAVILTLGLTLTSCTENTRARMYGGTQKVELPAGQKLVEATWKQSNLWYLTEPMEEGYAPKTKTFQESSQWGAMEGTVIFIERK